MKIITLYIGNKVYTGHALHRFSELVQLILSNHKSLTSVKIGDDKVVLAYASTSEFVKVAEQIKSEGYCMYTVSDV